MGRDFGCSAGLPRAYFVAMAILAYCRGSITHYRAINAMWVLTMLGLIFAGVPRWEVHQHAEADDHHAFEPFSHAHHSDSRESDATRDVDDGMTPTHCHAASSIAVAIFQIGLPALDPTPSRSDIFPEPETVLAANAGPPPQRPPIV